MKNKSGQPLFYKGNGKFPGCKSRKVHPLTKEEIVDQCHRAILMHHPTWESILHGLIMKSRLDIPLIITNDLPVFVKRICEKILKGEKYNG